MSEEESGNYLMAHAAGIATVLGYAFLLHLCGFLVSSVFRGTTSAWIRNAKKIRVGVPQPWASSCTLDPHAHHARRLRAPPHTLRACAGKQTFATRSISQTMSRR